MASKDEAAVLVALLNGLDNHPEFKAIRARTVRSLRKIEAESQEALNEELAQEAKEKADAEAQAKADAEAKAKADADAFEAAAQADPASQPVPVEEPEGNGIDRRV